MPTPAQVKAAQKTLLAAKKLQEKAAKDKEGQAAKRKQEIETQRAIKAAQALLKKHKVK